MDAPRAFTSPPISRADARAIRSKFVTPATRRTVWFFGWDVTRHANAASTAAQHAT
jgi:hypothetical protein